MEIIQAVKDTCTKDDAKNNLLSELDEALEDMKNGRVISEQEMWAELDTI